MDERRDRKVMAVIIMVVLGLMAVFGYGLSIRDEAHPLTPVNGMGTPAEVTMVAPVPENLTPVETETTSVSSPQPAPIQVPRPPAEPTSTPQ